MFSYNLRMAVIRQPRKDEIARLAEIEAMCFPPEEGASREKLERRFSSYPDGFLIAEEDGTILGFIDGLRTDADRIEDAMYEDECLDDPLGSYQSVLGISVIPEARGSGIGGLLLKSLIMKAEKEGRKGVFLTCKKALLPFYVPHGFIDRGISCSVHGNVAWHDMFLPLPKKK